MTITKEIKDKALRIGRKHKASKVWVNDQGEVFTEEQYAKASVKGDKDKYTPVEVTADVKEAKAEKSNELGKVEDVVAAIDAATEADAVQAILDAENGGKKRKTIIDAATAKLTTLK